MLDSRAQRVIALTLLFGALVGLTVWFGTVQPNPRLGYYPTEDQLALDYDSYVGAQVQIGGTVKETDPVEVVVIHQNWNGEEYQRGTSRLRVTGSVEGMTPGQAVQIYGTVQPDGTIHAEKSVVVPIENHLYMYTVSFLAGLWVLARIVWGWTVVWDEFALRRRTRPVRVVDAVRRRVRAEGSTDA